jgi:hypothetical protein
VRREIAALYEIEVSCTEPEQLIARYADLIARKVVKEEAIAKRATKKIARRARHGCTATLHP